jgi:apolipoprotein N-acyltransferase
MFLKFVAIPAAPLLVLLSSGGLAFASSSILYIANTVANTAPQAINNSREELLITVLTIGLIPAGLGSLKAWNDQRAKKDTAGWGRIAELEERSYSQLVKDRNDAIALVHSRDKEINRLNESLRIVDNQVVELTVTNRYQRQEITELQAEIISLKQELNMPHT